MKKFREFYRTGDVFIWFTGFGLAVTVAMIAGLLLLVTIKSTDYFYPSKLAKIQLKNGEAFLGEIKTVEKMPKLNLPDSLQELGILRYKIKIGNRDIYGLDFRWFDSRQIDTIYYPDNAVIIERTGYGNFHGVISGVSENGSPLKIDDSAMENYLSDKIDFVADLRAKIRSLERDEIGRINYDIENLRMKIKKAKFRLKDEAIIAKITEETEKQIAEEEKKFGVLEKEVDSLRYAALKYALTVNTADGMSKEIPLYKVIRIYKPNKMNAIEKAGFVIEKIWRFITDEPRESNTEGGVFPAIFGTVMMVILMSLAAVPFGVIAALFLREYSKQGIWVRTVRIAVNNLAGVPSIVFGVFGLGFFIYFIGGRIDLLFYPERLPTPTWGTGGILWASLTLALLTVPVVIVSTEEALAAIPRGVREAALALGSTKWQVIRKIVLPAAMPGILTGVILAMARGAGEVAPLMITGVVKLAPNLPIDGFFPFLHLDRKFMHLGFHIYDVGFQSPNVEAALPMVYMTTLLLIAIVLLLNITAMIIRNRLRRKYKSSTF